MHFRVPHRWDLTPGEARQVQERLRSRVEASDRVAVPARVAGVDVGIDRGAQRSRAAVAVLSWPGLELLEHARAERAVEFPYVPGLLSFRELPVVLTALGRLEELPDLILCDGQGFAHPRRFGLACHLGVVCDLPTIGVAKSRLIGTCDEPGPRRGSRTPLLDGGEIIGTVLRTRTGVRPVFVSVGHRVGLQTAVELVLQAAPRYRLPETTRWAHCLASRAD
jgi:deoxyribonuclease V